MGVPAEETVTITKKEYDELISDKQWACCLENAGVDNWEGFEYAQDLYEEMQ